MTLRILQFGTTGQVGLELLRQAPQHDVDVTALSRTECDLAHPDAAARIVLERRPQLVVLAAAYTAVDLAETERELAFRINAEAPGAIARACAQVGAALVWFSTDYVFSGDKGAPYQPDDPTDPPNAYGASKLAGEQAVLAACPRSLILRTSWVVSAHGKNFVKTMLRVAGAGGPLKVVDDQYGRPTSAADLAGFVLSQAPRLAAAGPFDPMFGVHHFANAGETTWKRFADGIFAAALGAAAPSVEPITTAERPAPARRPLRGTLDTSGLEAAFGVRLRPWPEALAEIVRELKTEGADA